MLASREGKKVDQLDFTRLEVSGHDCRVIIWNWCTKCRTMASSLSPQENRVLDMTMDDIYLSSVYSILLCMYNVLNPTSHT